MKHVAMALITQAILVVPYALFIMYLDKWFGGYSFLYTVACGTHIIALYLLVTRKDKE